MFYVDVEDVQAALDKAVELAARRSSADRHSDRYVRLVFRSGGNMIGLLKSAKP